MAKKKVTTTDDRSVPSLRTEESCEAFKQARYDPRPRLKKEGLSNLGSQKTTHTVNPDALRPERTIDKRKYHPKLRMESYPQVEDDCYQFQHSTISTRNRSRQNSPSRRIIFPKSTTSNQSDRLDSATSCFDSEDEEVQTHDEDFPPSSSSPDSPLSPCSDGNLDDALFWDQETPSLRSAARIELETPSTPPSLQSTHCGIKFQEVERSPLDYKNIRSPATPRQELKIDLKSIISKRLQSSDPDKPERSYSEHVQPSEDDIEYEPAIAKTSSLDTKSSHKLEVFLDSFLSMGIVFKSLYLMLIVTRFIVIDVLGLWLVSRESEQAEVMTDHFYNNNERPGIRRQPPYQTYSLDKPNLTLSHPHHHNDTKRDALHPKIKRQPLTLGKENFGGLAEFRQLESTGNTSEGNRSLRTTEYDNQNGKGATILCLTVLEDNRKNPILETWNARVTVPTFVTRRKTAQEGDTEEEEDAEEIEERDAEEYTEDDVEEGTEDDEAGKVEEYTEEDESGEDRNKRTLDVDARKLEKVMETLDDGQDFSTYSFSKSTKSKMKACFIRREKLSASPESRRGFSPYSPKFQLNRPLDEVLWVAATALLNPTELKDGLVYVYLVVGDSPGFSDLRKIGVTSKSTAEKRLKSPYKTCGYESKLVYPFTPTPTPVKHAARLEKILHAALRNYRYIQTGCPCNTRHKEWFDAPDELILAEIKKWTSWINKNAYTGRRVSKEAYNTLDPRPLENLDAANTQGRSTSRSNRVWTTI